MAIFFGGPLRRGRLLFAACLVFLAAPCAGLAGGLEEGTAHLKRAWAHVEPAEWEAVAQEAAEAVSLLRGSGKQDLIEALKILGAAERMLGRSALAAYHFQEGLAACGSCAERNDLRVGLASAYRDLGRYSEAESLLRDLLAEAKAAGSTEIQASSLKGLGFLADAYLKRAGLHTAHAKWEPAAREAAAAVSLLREFRKQDLPEALEILGGAELMGGHPAQAADHLQEGLTACGSCAERNRLRFLLSTAYRDLSRFGEAESLLRELLVDAEAAGSVADQTMSLEGLAGVAAVQGHRAEALLLLQEAVRREDAAGKPSADRAGDLESIGVLLSEQGDGVQALEYLRQAESLLGARADPARLLRIRTNKASAYRVLGRYDKALDLFKEVETASRKQGNETELARSLCGSAEVLQIQNQLEEAQKRFEEALVVERRNSRRGGQARALNGLAQIDLVRGRYDRAFSRFQEAVAISGAGADRESEMIALGASTDIYTALNQDEESFARLNRVGKLADEIATQNPALKALSTVLQLFTANRLDEALQQIDQALALARQTGARPREAWTLGLRAMLLFSLKRLEEGRHDAEAALALGRELGDRKYEAQLSFILGFILLHQQRYEEARTSLEHALRFEREIGSSGPRAATLWALGASQELAGNSVAAIAAYRESVEVSESAFPEVRADDLLSGLAEKAVLSYGHWIKLLARQGDAEQAFAVAERARARTFLRRMGNPPPDVRKAVDPALLREEDSLGEKIRALTEQLQEEQAKVMSGTDHPALYEVAKEIDTARRDYATLRIRLQQASPEYASLVNPSPLTVPEVRKLLDGQTTLIEYFGLEEETLAWVIERDSLHLVHLPVHGEVLAQQVKELRQRITAHEPVTQLALLLYTGLFGPLVPYLHHTNILVVPHGALHALPFAALSPDAGKTWLVERYALSVLPSASVLPFLLAKRNREGGGMLALGDPDGSLPAAAAEARAVAALYGSRALVGQEASAAALRSAPRPIGHLHIAAHAGFDAARPLFSRIRLADGDLAAHDIFGLDLRGTHLVVLSGCETGVGQGDVGDLEGLSRAFLYAGASAVVATLWKVDDHASRALMQTFYQRLRAGAPTAEALRQAQLETLRSSEWRHPFFWAAFTLNGDPTAGSREE